MEVEEEERNQGMEVMKNAKEKTMVIDKKILDSVSEQAKNSPRLRMNFNFHQSLDEKCHRLSDARPRTRLGKAYASIALLCRVERRSFTSTLSRNRA